MRRQASSSVVVVDVRSTLLLLILTLMLPSSVAPWSYRKSEEWLSSFPSCRGKSQSPINLPDPCQREDFYESAEDGGRVLVPAALLNDSLGIQFIGYDVDLSTDRLELVNTGHTLALTLRNSDESPGDGSPGVRLSPDPSSSFYQFAQLHFYAVRFKKVR